MSQKEAPKPPARSFQFVSLTPGLAGDDVVKADHRRLVRSNAATFQWSQQRISEKQSPSYGHSQAAKGSDSKKRKSSGSTPNENTDEYTSSGANYASSSIYGTSNALVTIGGPGVDTYMPSPQQYTVVSPMDQAGQQLRFNVHYIIPRLVPEIQKGVENPVSDLWVTLALENPSLYHTWVHCVSVYYFALRGQWEQSKSLLSTHSRALEAVSQEMQNSLNACSDSNILAVWGLAVHGWEKFLPPGHRVPNQGRMRYLQSLDRYSLMKFVPLHLDGLDMLIEMRGGLDQVQSEGIAALVSYTGIVQATKALGHPRWPYKTICKTFQRLQGMNVIINSTSPLAKLGSGFLPAMGYPESGPLKELLDVTQDISSFTIFIHNYELGNDFLESVGQVADQRNLIQYNLMSLPESSLLQLAPPELELYETSRLAIIFFSLLIIFPLAPSAAPFVQLATRLGAHIEDIDIYQTPLEELKLITWAVYMGGIAAVGSVDRPWYVSMLDTFFLHLDIGSWDEVKAILKSFLWLESTNDTDGILLWQELMQLRSYKRQFEAPQHPGCNTWTKFNPVTQKLSK